MTFDECCNAVIKAAREKPSNYFLQYAASYARAGIGMTGEKARVQALYILSNLAYWRGEKAKEVKAALKGYTK